MQTIPIIHMLPKSIWKLIIQDQWVDFEKLHASLEHGYDHNDNAKDFGNGYVIMKKDHLTSRRPIRTEAEWIRVFEAWSTGVTLLYPHRSMELKKYRLIVDEVFRASPQNVSPAIRFDVEVRRKYSRGPFRMDDHGELQALVLAQMYRPSATPTLPLAKRIASDSHQPSPAKRADIPCQLWNMGKCNDPCVNRRKHGTCSECGDSHRAYDTPTCRASLFSQGKDGTSADA
ncbi:unnamed protein product [Cyclocybe aegerita]|uniref:Uncharacterized protein n=1 Tax=Cyclocybe aegerita TaxID=1973307 RepID=A0A8S0W3W2_CYCAE|nr:unnamed protein product [Cyclocybe aegerita]